MKKFRWLFLILCLVLSLTIISCGDDDKKDDNSTGPTVDPEDFDFCFAISSYELAQKEINYEIMLASYSGEVIEEATLAVDGEAIELFVLYDIWYCDIVLDDSGTHNFNVNINDESYDFDLDLASAVTATWPETYVHSVGMTVDWTLSPNTNSQYQFFYGYAYNSLTYEEEDKEELLEASDRSFDVPANWFGDDYDSYSFDIDEVNYIVEDNLLALSFEMAYADYGSYKKGVTNVDRMRRIAKSLDK